MGTVRRRQDCLAGLAGASRALGLALLLMAVLLPVARADGGWPLSWGDGEYGQLGNENIPVPWMPHGSVMFDAVAVAAG